MQKGLAQANPVPAQHVKNTKPLGHGQRLRRDLRSRGAAGSPPFGLQTQPSEVRGRVELDLDQAAFARSLGPRVQTTRPKAAGLSARAKAAPLPCECQGNWRIRKSSKRIQCSSSAGP